MLHARFWGLNLRVVSMSLDMLFQILGTLVSVAAEMAFMRLERHMNLNMRFKVITFGSISSTNAPLTSQV